MADENRINPTDLDPHSPFRRFIASREGCQYLADLKLDIVVSPNAVSIPSTGFALQLANSNTKHGEQWRSISEKGIASYFYVKPDDEMHDDRLKEIALEKFTWGPLRSELIRRATNVSGSNESGPKN